MRGLIIYDFDGVIGDSEVLANEVLAALVSELGVPTTREDSCRRYMGKRLADVLAAVEAATGRPAPPEFPAEIQARTLQRLRRDLVPVAGAREFIAAFADHPRCIASSSSPDRLAVCLEVLGLAEAFRDCVFSAATVPRGKPHPDIFLHAARIMATDPADCIVIEDSAGGIEAARAAGMCAIGLLAGSHVQPGHADRLSAAGAHHVAASFSAAEPIVSAFLRARAGA
ncbi:MAG: HAD family phosphatase [Hyphomicrobiaceae bacterium]|nr:HAD family phosphatase [Hyphomicrobiaceae bacterium]